MIVPPALTPRSKFRVIAPSGPFDRAQFEVAIKWLSSRYDVSFSPDIFDKAGFLAGSDPRRRRELQLAIDNPNVSAILTARGGWGAARIVDSVDFSGLLRNPKWIVGFSDATTLHVKCWQLGVASLHAGSLTSLAACDENARQNWLSALEVPLQLRIVKGTPVVGGRCCGPLVGGNLTIIVSCLAKGMLTLPPRCILALEDVAESSYRVDRMLDALLTAHVARSITGVVLGQFTNCDGGKYDVATRDVLWGQFSRFGVPTLSDVQFGHGLVNIPLLFGCSAAIDAQRGELCMGSK